MFLKVLVFSMVLPILAGCAGGAWSTVTAQARGLDEIALVARYIDGELHPVPRPDEPGEISLEMPLIPGALTGEVMTAPVITARARIGKAFTIDLDRHQEAIARYATPLLKTRYNSGLTVTPASRKMVRLGTFASNPANGHFLGPTGLRDLEADNQVQLFLLYFDGPAVITGTGREGNTTITYDIEVKEQGFLWVEVTRTGENTLAVINRRSNRDVTLTIKAPRKPATKV